MALGASILQLTLAALGGDNEQSYDRNKLAIEFNKKTMELHRTDKPRPRVIRRKVREEDAPFMLGI